MLGWQAVQRFWLRGGTILDPAIQCDEDDGCEAMCEVMGIYAGPNTTIPAATVRLLADLRCFCRQSGVDFESALVASQRILLEEKRAVTTVATAMLALCVGG
jgi:hypothetical protein